MIAQLAAGLALASSLVPERHYDVVVYGGSLPAYAALVQLARTRPSSRALLVVPQSEIGEIATSGAQNFWDVLVRKERYLGGTMENLYRRTGHAFEPRALAIWLEADLRSRVRVEIEFRTDISKVRVENHKVVGVDLRALKPSPKGIDHFSGPTRAVRAPLFVDASYNGRLLRLAGFTGIVGRTDIEPGSRRQQAVTLMYQLQGLDLSKIALAKQFVIRSDADGSRYLVGGEPFVGPAQTGFNTLYKDTFRFKGPNIAEGRPNVFWVNGLVMYGVDGTKEEKDRGGPHYPNGKLLSVDEAYKRHGTMLANADFLRAIRSYAGFEKAKVVGHAQMLYVRETLHSSLVRDPGPEDFAITNADFANAGSGPLDGRDRRHYERRISLAWYYMDSQGYYSKDPIASRIHRMVSWIPKHPAYVPYDVMLNPALKNVLICGYGLNASSTAWYPLRVLPNLTMVGDACGVAAALALEKKIEPSEFDLPEIREVQRRLLQAGAKLDKTK